jgi:hypothetical protein
MASLLPPHIQKIMFQFSGRTLKMPLYLITNGMNSAEKQTFRVECKHLFDLILDYRNITVRQ